MVKAYNLTIDYVLYELSHANMLLYGSVLPSNSSDNKKEGEVINADDPKNIDLIRNILFE